LWAAEAQHRFSVPRGPPSAVAQALDDLPIDR